jgi:hypothetical protein
MKDSQSSRNDGGTILFMLMLALMASAGFSSAASSLGAKDQAIATQKQQIEELQERLIESEARFEGYQQGRR